jgi:hypothetical protein
MMAIMIYGHGSDDVGNLVLSLSFPMSRRSGAVSIFPSNAEFQEIKANSITSFWSDTFFLPQQMQSI